jgi:hypothetical protein
VLDQQAWKERGKNNQLLSPSPATHPVGKMASPTENYAWGWRTKDNSLLPTPLPQIPNQSKQNKQQVIEKFHSEYLLSFAKH